MIIVGNLYIKEGKFYLEALSQSKLILNFRLALFLLMMELERRLQPRLQLL